MTTNNIFTLALSMLWICGQAQTTGQGQPSGRLFADGQSDDTYQLMRSCGYNYEVPDVSRGHASKPFRHVQQTFDKTLGKNVFQFFIHAAIDDDRGRANVTDRQRVEIKTDTKSPASMVGQKGETLTFKWKFMLPRNFVTTNRFCHIHQLKGLDNKAGDADVGMPLITFTCYTKTGGKETMEVRYDNRNDGSGQTTVAKAPLDDFKGEWVDVVETVAFGEKGSYEVTISRVKNGKVLLQYAAKDIDMWRSDCVGMRPKWGIYRSLGKDGEQRNLLRDEELRFADFEIIKH